MALKLVFAGTPDFAAQILEVLAKSNHQILAVLTQADRPKGRGQVLSQSPVKQLAFRHTIPVYQPARLKEPDIQKILSDLKPDLMIVAAYGLILPKEILSIPKYGCMNVHASLLPHWRGASPIQHSILNGDAITGITMMQMNEGLDTGDILAVESCAIELHETSGSLQERLATIAGPLLLNTLQQLKQKKLKPIKQENEFASYAPKISKQEAKIDWTKSTSEIDRIVRAFNPWPIAFSSIDGQTIRIFEGEPLDLVIEVLPGIIVQSSTQGILVGTGEGVYKINQLQLPGGKPMKVKEILNSKSSLFQVGKKLE